MLLQAFASDTTCMAPLALCTSVGPVATSISLAAPRDAQPVLLYLRFAFLFWRCTNSFLLFVWWLPFSLFSGLKAFLYLLPFVFTLCVLLLLWHYAFSLFWVFHAQRSFLRATAIFSFTFFSQLRLSTLLWVWCWLLRWWYQLSLGNPNSSKC